MREKSLQNLKRGGSKGRVKGVPNRVTAEVKLAATAIVDDPVYRRNLYAAMIDRTVAPAIEQMLWFYAKGKPKETIAADGSFSIRWLREADDEPGAPD
jgi:hypothetical protein